MFKWEILLSLITIHKLPACFLKGGLEGKAYTDPFSEVKVVAHSLGECTEDPLQFCTPFLGVQGLPENFPQISDLETLSSTVTFLCN